MIYSNVQRLRLNVKQVGDFLASPELTPDLGKASLPTIVRVMFCLIVAAVDTQDEIASFLAERGCDLDGKSIEFLLGLFDGDDERFHLWQRLSHGRYSPHWGDLDAA